MPNERAASGAAALLVLVDDAFRAAGFETFCRAYTTPAAYGGPDIVVTLVDDDRIDLLRERLAAELDEGDQTGWTCERLGDEAGDQDAGGVLVFPASQTRKVLQALISLAR
ncbi:MAG: hypothetical protein ACXVXC_07195 [Nocardioidaceae bacterium]